MKQTKRLNKGNHLAYKFLEQAQKAVVACNAMGLTVTAVDFSQVKPKLRVMHNCVTEQALEKGTAFIYKRGCDESAMRYWEGQMMIEGIKTVFRCEELNPNWRPTKPHYQ